MKNLLLTITIGLLIASCSTGTQPDKKPKTHKAGLWTVHNNYNLADWDGTQNNRMLSVAAGSSDPVVQGDTVVYNHPTDSLSMHMRVVHKRDFDLARIEIADSTLNRAIQDSLDLSTDTYHSVTYKSVNAGEVSYRKNYTVLRLYARFRCNVQDSLREQFNKQHDGYVEFWIKSAYSTDRSYIYKYYKIKVGDFYKPADDLCADAPYES